MATPDREALGHALGKLPSGLFICSCGTGETSVPFLASWVQQVSMDPPSVSVAIKDSRKGLDALDDQDGAFTLSILPEGAPHLMKPFFSENPTNPFGGLELGRAPHGGTYLIEALGWLECREYDRVRAGDHVVIIGETTSGALLGDGTPHVHIRNTGFSY